VGEHHQPGCHWDYADTRGWVANWNGAVSRGVVGALGNQLRCDTFTGYRWTTRTAPVRALGYLS